MFDLESARACLGIVVILGVCWVLPERRGEVMSLVWKAMMAGFLATCMTAAVVGALPATLYGG